MIYVLAAQEVIPIVHVAYIAKGDDIAYRHKDHNHKASHFLCGHVDGEVDQPVRVAPLVVIPTIRSKGKVVCIHTYIHTYIHVNSTCVIHVSFSLTLQHVYTHMYIYIHAHIHLYTYICTCMYMYTHIFHVTFQGLN